ncbi:GTP-binding protein rho4 [Elsinoe australis]|uniref:GTP-binding protein rho4 n=1 Tax=Elsinoe australis TaxID=40998 RepID=A0A2P8A084_9PEZI|nr:GTP-binding protein rho4 [Elsinoe australis]
MAAIEGGPAPFPDSDVPGRLFPVCCAAVISPEILDKFFYDMTDHCPQANDSFVIVDSLTGSYMEEMEPGGDESTSSTSPFKGKSPYECSQLLKQLRRDTGSDIDYNSFIIMDERTLRDNTILIVEEPEEADGGASNSVRATFELASNLLLYLSGKSSAYEQRELAETTEDGVLRPGMHH